MEIERTPLIGSHPLKSDTLDSLEEMGTERTSLNGSHVINIPEPEPAQEALLTWNGRKQERIEVLKKMGSTSNGIVRYWIGANSKNPSDIIMKCFDPLSKVRDDIEKNVERVRKDARTRGYLMILGQMATGGTLFLPFTKKNFDNTMKKFTGLGIYYIVMITVGVLIFLSLKHLLKEFNKISKAWEELLNDTDIRLQEFGFVCDDANQINNAKRFREEDAIVAKLQRICDPLDFGFMGSKLVWIEMGIASAVFLAIPLAATLTRLS